MTYKRLHVIFAMFEYEIYYKFPLNELVIKPTKLRFCLAKYKFYAGCFRKM